MIRFPLLLAAAAALAPAAYAHDKPLSIAAAVAESSRPAAETALDADRKPAEMLKFIGVKPGMTVVDLLPGGGYFTRLFADVVGPKGTVIGYVPDEMLKSDKNKERFAGLSAIAPNVQTKHDPLISPAAIAVADVVWTAQNYHDLHNIPGADLTAFNKQVFASLKPGGVYVVLDHAAKPGSGLADTKTTHRIDPAVVKQEVLAAGFVFDGESKVLANPADDHTLNVLDPGVRHKTDQFIYKFRKPK